LTNREKVEYILNQITKAKYKPYKIEYGNGYFIFEMGEDAVCHFKIKGILGWKFAIWINTNEENKNIFATVFTQYEKEIDKFKPSRSYYHIELEQWQIDGDFMYDLVNMINEIKKYPFVAYYHNVTNIKWHIPTLKAFWYFVKNRYINIVQNFNNWFESTCEYLIVWFKLFYAKLIHDKVYYFKIIDKNTEEFRCYPRYEIEVGLNKDMYTDDELKSWENKYFKNNWNNFSRIIKYME
jgi:hypothetical protein